MKKIIILLLITIFVFTISTKQISAENLIDAGELKIKIVSSENGFSLHTSEGFQLLDGYTVIETVYDNNIKIYYNNGIFIESGSSNYGPYMDIKVKANDNKVIYNNHEYNGLFTLAENGRSLVNIIDMETYIYSVVANEVGDSFEVEAIKAQALAARSYALYNSKKFIDKGYNLTSDAISQVYRGNKGVSQKIKDAVDETRGEVIVYNDEIIDATYGSTSGGATAAAEDTWGKAFPYLIAKSDPYSLNSPRVNWTYKTNTGLIDQNLSKGTNMSNFTSIVFNKNELGRIVSVGVEYAGGKVSLRAERFRSLMGVSNLKSTKFEINSPSLMDGTNQNESLYKSCLLQGYGRASDSFTLYNNGGNDEVEFVGMGVGHGVGMSQYGANEMAKQNFNYRDIVRFYYEGAEVKKIYDWY